MGGSGGGGGGFGGGWTGEAGIPEGSSNYGGWDYGGGPEANLAQMNALELAQTFADLADVSRGLDPLGGQIGPPGSGPDPTTQAALAFMPMPTLAGLLIGALTTLSGGGWTGGGFPDVGSAGPGGLGGPSETMPTQQGVTPVGITLAYPVQQTATTGYASPNFAAMAQGLISSKDTGSGYKRLGTEAMKDRGYLSNLYQLARKLGSG